MLALFIVDVQALAAKFPAHFEITDTEISFNSTEYAQKKVKRLIKSEVQTEKKINQITH